MTTPKDAKKLILDRLEHYEMLLGAEYYPFYDFVEETLDEIRLPAKGKGNKDKMLVSELVTMTQEQYDKLKVIYGTSERLEYAFGILDDYIPNKPKPPYASHYHVLVKTNWVYKRVVEDLGEYRAPQENKRQDGDGDNYIYV